MTVEAHTDDLHQLLATLPPDIHDALMQEPVAELVEVVMDLGRRPQARYPGRAIDLAGTPTSKQDLERVIAAVGQFSADNRAGIEGTLHRISAIRNRQGRIIGLTLRVGRAVFGTIDPLRDLIEDGRSVLLLGRPGVGKTTRLRETARILADELAKRVIIIDTSNEIAGDGDIPHPAIGSARRMQVPHPDAQHGVMIEAVENHMPEVIVIDEIGTAAEAMAARTIAERGVQLIGTAHGTALENLLRNPTLSDLVGGVQTVTLGDEEARLRGSQKTVSERRGPPTFNAVVEIVSREEVVVHPDTAPAVDALLAGRRPRGIRRGADGFDLIVETEERPRPSSRRAPLPDERRRPVAIYPYAISRDQVERVLRDLRLDARTVHRPDRADFVLALRSRSGDPKLRQLLEQTDLPLHLVKKNTTAQIRRLLQGVFSIIAGAEEEEVAAAVREAETAAREVLSQGVSATLPPRSASLRELQHRVAVRHQLTAESEGSEPQRHLVIHPR